MVPPTVHELKNPEMNVRMENIFFSMKLEIRDTGLFREVNSNNRTLFPNVIVYSIKLSNNTLKFIYPNNV